MPIACVTRPSACDTAHDSASAIEARRLARALSGVRARCRRAPRTPCMRAMLVVVLLELDKRPLEISRGPEQQAIQAFAPYGPNQPFDDWMGARHVRHRLDFPDVEDPQVRRPLRNRVQRSRVATG